MFGSVPVLRVLDLTLVLTQRLLRRKSCNETRIFAPSPSAQPDDPGFNAWIRMAAFAMTNGRSKPRMAGEWIR